MKYFSLIALAFIVCSMAACGGNKRGSDCNAGYNQKTMLISTADQVIIPAFKKLKEELSVLNTKTIAFANNPSESTLEENRQAFRSAYMAWQHASYFSFGPSAEIFLNQKVNGFPLNKGLLEANVSFGNYNLDATDNYYSGFPAVDYLLYLADNEEEIVATYTTGEKASAYKDYLKAVVALMSEKATIVYNKWTNSYRAEFIANTGTADGTGLALLVNAINENLENTRREKIGIPSGNHDVNVPAFPEKVEAYYSGISKELLAESVKAAKAFFTAANDEGLDDYLDYAKAKKDSKDLSTVINDQFDLVISKISEIDGKLSDAITNNPSQVQAVYTPLANQVVYLKTDMPSALCVSITYIDNPSDSD